MHHCLEIDEILRLIFEEVSENCRQWGKRDGSLVALALTCRVFSGIALDLLWSAMNTLAPLVMCLPAHLWEKRFESAGGHGHGGIATRRLVRRSTFFLLTFLRLIY
jgi:hypothetical protein